MSFREEPLSIKVYILAVSFAGLIFLLFHLPQLGSINIFNLLFFIMLRILLEHLDVPLPQGNGVVSVSFAVDLTLIVLFGPAAAAWASASTIIHKRTFTNFTEIGHKMVFNAAQTALTTGLAGNAFLAAGGSLGDISSWQNIIPFVVCITVFFLVNIVLVLIAVSLSQKKTFIRVWLANIRWAVPNYLATAPLGILVAAVFKAMGIPGVLLLMVPLMIARHTFIMYMDMRNQYVSTIKALTKAIDAKDHYTHGHSERVAKYSVWIGAEMKLPENFLEQLEYIALMHDIGKVGIPEQILNKPSRLSDEEYTLVKDHAAVGADIISSIKFIGDHADIVRHHHERVDGMGYPDGITGDKMSLGAKIVGVADAYDAMVSRRVYRQPLTKAEAVEELQLCSNSQFDEDVVKAFVKVLRQKGEIT